MIQSGDQEPENTRHAPTLKGKARRPRLPEKAAGAFLELGSAEASMQRIVRQSGGSASTAYPLSGNKEGLLIAVLQREVERMVACVQPRSVRFYRLVLSASLKRDQFVDHLRQQARLQMVDPLACRLRAARVRGEWIIAEPEPAALMLSHRINGIALEARLDGGHAEGPSERDLAACRHGIAAFSRAFQARPA